MTARAQDQLERLLLALPLLADETELPLRVLADRVGTTVHTLLGDLQALATRQQDVAGFVESVELYLGPTSVGARTSHFRRPMRLTRAELAALDLGLGMLLHERPMEERSTILRARTKLREASVSPPATVSQGVTVRAPEVPRRPIGAEAVSDALVAQFGRLCQAQEDRRAVRLTYQRADAAPSDVRVVHPWAIVRVHQHTYVVAWCTAAAAVRVFRLDRILEVEIDGSVFDVPADFDLEEILRDGRIFSGERPEDELVVRYSPTVARWVSEREGVPLADDGSVTVRWPLADDEWAVRHVLQYGVDATVLEPPRIRTLAIERLTAMLST
jgi:proteasome accessory factor C